jgi:hypothetical protein
VTIAGIDAIWNYAGVVANNVFSSVPVVTSIAVGPGQVLTFSSVSG